MQDDELRKALERRAGRADGHGPDAALGRAYGQLRPRRGGRGSWMAAAAALVLLAGLATYVASQDDSDTTSISSDPSDRADGIGTTEEADPLTGDGLEGDGRSPAVAQADSPPQTLTATITDLADELEGTTILVVNGTWGRFAHDLVEEVAELRPGGPLPFAALAVLSTPDAPVQTSSIIYAEARYANAAERMARAIGVGPEEVRQGDVAPERWSVRPEPDMGSIDLVLVIGADLDADGAKCQATYDDSLCNGYRGPFMEQEAILHPAAEVAVLVANGGSGNDVAGRMVEILDRRGYPNAVAIDANDIATSVVYYSPGYEVDARAVWQRVFPTAGRADAVKPMPANPPVDDLADAQILVVLASDFDHPDL